MAAAKEIAKTLIRPFRSVAAYLSQHGYLPAWIYQRLPYTWSVGRFRIYGDGFSFWFAGEPDHDGLTYDLFWTGLRIWERETFDLFIPLARRARLFLDVGAHGGTFSLAACAVNPACRVIAFEPLPETFKALQGNIVRNGLEGRVSCRQQAVSDFDGKAYFQIHHNRSRSSLDVPAMERSPDKHLEVDVVRLDTALAGGPDPDLIKIDVELFEPHVLRGMKGLLARAKPDIIMECIPGVAVEEIENVLAPLGYRFHWLTAQGPQASVRIIPDDSYRNWLCTVTGPSALAEVAVRHLGRVNE